MSALDHRLARIYLFDSLPLGDFDPASSAIEFIAVTVDKLDGDDISRLFELPAELMAHGVCAGVCAWKELSSRAQRSGAMVPPARSVPSALTRRRIISW